MSRLSSEEAPVITWGVKYDTKLFGFYNIAEQRVEGFDIDIAKALTEVITEGQGQAEFVEVTSKTRIPLLKNGNIDAIIATMTISEERLKQVNFSDVYFAAGQSLLVPEESEIEGIDTLTDQHTIIAIKGSTSANNIRELAPQANVIEMENYSEGFVALQSGQGDALTTDNAILLGMISEIIRAGLVALPKGQMEAGISTGLTKGQVMVNILLPQMVRQTLPSIVSQLIALIKDTSLATIISLPEITHNAKIIYGQDTSTVIPMFLALALFYFIICYALSKLSKHLSNKFQIA